MGMVIVMQAVFFYAIPGGILGLALGAAWASSGDRSPGVRVCLTLAAGIGGAALGFVAGFCFVVASWSAKW